jgi:hypothetical protein
MGQEEKRREAEENSIPVYILDKYSTSFFAARMEIHPVNPALTLFSLTTRGSNDTFSLLA